METDGGLSNRFFLFLQWDRQRPTWGGGSVGETESRASPELVCGFDRLEDAGHKFVWGNSF